jgi:hypothetical protein
MRFKDCKSQEKLDNLDRAASRKAGTIARVSRIANKNLVNLTGKIKNKVEKKSKFAPLSA